MDARMYPFSCRGLCFFSSETGDSKCWTVIKLWRTSVSKRTKKKQIKYDEFQAAVEIHGKWLEAPLNSTGRCRLFRKVGHINWNVLNDRNKLSAIRMAQGSLLAVMWCRMSNSRRAPRVCIHLSLFTQDKFKYWRNKNAINWTQQKIYFSIFIFL